MWYGFLDGCVTVETKAKSQKVQNLRRDPRLTLLFEDGDYYEELRGVELVGKAEIIDDPDQLWTLGVSVFERYYGRLQRRPQALPRDHAAQAGGHQAACSSGPSAGTTASSACRRPARASSESSRLRAGCHRVGLSIWVMPSSIPPASTSRSGVVS